MSDAERAKCAVCHGLPNGKLYTIGITLTTGAPMSRELKPCPYCGGRAYMRVLLDQPGFPRFVKCDVCGARQPPASREDAIKKWNKRTDGGDDE